MLFIIISKIVCANIKDSSWYYFNDRKGGKWEETEMGHELVKRLSNDIVDVYNYYGGIYKNRANDLLLEDEDAASSSLINIQNVWKSKSS